MACFYFWCRYYVNLCTWLCQSREPPQVSEQFPSCSPYSVWNTLSFCSGFEVGPAKPPSTINVCLCVQMCVCSLAFLQATGWIWHRFFWLVEEKCVSEVKNLPFKFLYSLYQDYNSYPGLNTKWPCYSFPQIFWKAKSEARENTGLNPMLLEPKINGIYMKVGFGLLHLSFKAIRLTEYKYCMMPQSCTSKSAQRLIFPYWTRQIL